MVARTTPRVAHELQLGHNRARGALSPRRLELELHLPLGIELDPLVSKRRGLAASDDAGRMNAPKCGLPTLPTLCIVQRVSCRA